MSGRLERLAAIAGEESMAYELARGLSARLRPATSKRITVSMVRRFLRGSPAVQVATDVEIFEGLAMLASGAVRLFGFQYEYVDVEGETYVLDIDEVRIGLDGGPPPSLPWGPAPPDWMKFTVPIFFGLEGWERLLDEVSP